MTREEVDRLHKESQSAFDALAEARRQEARARSLTSRATRRYIGELDAGGGELDLRYLRECLAAEDECIADVERLRPVFLAASDALRTARDELAAERVG